MKIPHVYSGAATGLTVLQSMMWPDPEVATEQGLFFRTEGAVSFSLSAKRVTLQAGAALHLGTWGNLFNLGRWAAAAGLDSLVLELQGAGQAEVAIYQTQPGAHKRQIFCDPVTLAQDRPARIDLSFLAQSGDDAGVLSVSLRGLAQGVLFEELRWSTEMPARHAVSMALVIPCFHREAAVTKCLERLKPALESTSMDVIVIDQAGGFDVPDQPKLRIIRGENCGGSGGFARGMMAARGMGRSHCLFMDDDALADPEAVLRSYRFLSYATDARTAISGAMIAEHNHKVLWERGARFWQFCRPCDGGVDLTNEQRAIEVELQSDPGTNPHFYGGWWFFAFPIQAATHLPYPFFLRGDDVSFCLANDFKCVTLNGVAAIQEGFTQKETPRSWYLDLRSHLAHHLSLNDLQISTLSLLKIPLFFFGQTLLRMHYDSASAVLSAMQDVLRGPGFFAQNAHMAARLAEIDHATESEIWSDTPAMSEGRRPARQGKGRAAQPFWYLSGNGLLLPFFRAWGRHVVIRAADRRNRALVLGASRVVVLHPTKQTSYTVCHSKRRALQLSFRFLWLCGRYLWLGRRLRRAYQQAYAPLTSEAFWLRIFDGRPVGSGPR